MKRFYMSMDSIENEHAIIGEAAMSLTLAKREISVASLFAELSYMAESGNCCGRNEEISAAIFWLMRYGASAIGKMQFPSAQASASLN